MDPFVDEVQSNLGEALRAIGATFIKHSVTGQGLQETNVCFFSASRLTVIRPKLFSLLGRASAVNRV